MLCMLCVLCAAWSQTQRAQRAEQWFVKVGTSCREVRWVRSLTGGSHQALRTSAGLVAAPPAAVSPRCRILPPPHPPPPPPPPPQAVASGDIKILPERFEKVYNYWLENIKDWCISRQLWWGHRIPVWCVGCCNSGQGGSAAAALGTVVRAPRARRRDVAGMDGRWSGRPCVQALTQFLPPRCSSSALALPCFAIAAGMSLTARRQRRRPAAASATSWRKARRRRGNKRRRSMERGWCSSRCVEDAGAGMPPLRCTHVAELRPRSGLWAPKGAAAGRQACACCACVCRRTLTACLCRSLRTKFVFLLSTGERRAGHLVLLWPVALLNRGLAQRHARL